MKPIWVWAKLVSPQAKEAHDAILGLGAADPL